MQCTQTVPTMLTTIFILILIIFVPVTVLELSSYNPNVPDSFGCGTDEVCICEESKDCIRKKDDSKTQG